MMIQLKQGQTVRVRDEWGTLNYIFGNGVCLVTTDDDRQVSVLMADVELPKVNRRGEILPVGTPQGAGERQEGLGECFPSRKGCQALQSVSGDAGEGW